MNIGPGEILVVLVVALLVFGPKRLPEVGRQVGAAMRELRRMQHTVRAELDQALNLDGTLTGSSAPEAPPASAATAEDIDHPARPEIDLPEIALPAIPQADGSRPKGTAPEISMPDELTPPPEPDDGFESPRTFS